MVFTSPRHTFLLPKVEVVSAKNSRQLEKRFTFLWTSAHHLLSTSNVLANHMIASMMQLARTNHAQLPQSVLDFICESCGGLLVPSVSASVRIVPQSRKSPANRRLGRQHRRAQLESGINGAHPVRETLSTIVRVTCYRCQHVNDRPGASQVHKARMKKRVREEEEQPTTTTVLGTKKTKTDSEETAQHDKLKVARSLAAPVELSMASTSPLAPTLSSLPKKLLDKSKKRTKKKKTQSDAAVVAVKNNLSSFLQGFNARK
ncbi:unnamed protein product [Peronospora belbahrii]|uniref:Uncharacterized protein n=1 Tax=Peronospora belbahrii TaxID=622444 RepID=A0AAU9KMD5_9STRA|nr:unnamed protein product [Peronospora belbahrii]CAH0518596.1 unnamed protein product [Peronospora belbahrii]